MSQRRSETKVPLAQFIRLRCRRLVLIFSEVWLLPVRRCAAADVSF
jgi:hypothetical protein